MAKILILGGNPESIRLIQAAQRCGFYVIVADYNKNSVAKLIADKGLDLDASDVKSICQFCQDEKIEGVLVGVADKLVSTYKEICEKLGVPCYADVNDLDCLTNKLEFAKKCFNFDLQTIPNTPFYRGSSPFPYKTPVFIKPIDSSAGSGVRYCHKKENLEAAITDAFKFTNLDHLLVEPEMTGQDIGIYFEFDEDGSHLVGMYDRFTVKQNDKGSRIATLMLYPSKYIDHYRKTEETKFKRMFLDLGVKKGVCLVSAFFQNDSFYFYDPGFRFQGEATDHYLKYFFEYDQRENLANYAVGNKSEFKVSLLDPYFKGQNAATIWILLKPGVIGKIQGLEYVESMPCTIKIDQRLKSGDEIFQEWIGTEKQVFARIYTVGNSREECISNAKIIYDHIIIKAVDGHDMRVSPSSEFYN